jgi:hypothetical protein
MITITADNYLLNHIAVEGLLHASHHQPINLLHYCRIFTSHPRSRVKYTLIVGGAPTLELAYFLT